MPALEAILRPKAKRLNGIMLEYLLLAAIGRTRTFDELATKEVLQRATQAAPSSPHPLPQRRDASTRTVGDQLTTEALGSAGAQRCAAALQSGGVEVPPVATLPMASFGAREQHPLLRAGSQQGNVDLSMEELEKRISFSAIERVLQASASKSQGAGAAPFAAAEAAAVTLRDPPPLDRLYQVAAPNFSADGMRSSGGGSWQQPLSLDGGSRGGSLSGRHGSFPASQDQGRRLFPDSSVAFAQKRSAADAGAEAPAAKRASITQPPVDKAWLAAFDSLVQMIDTTGVLPTNCPLGDWAQEQLAEARGFGISPESTLTNFQYLKLTSIPAFMAELTRPKSGSGGGP